MLMKLVFNWAIYLYIKVHNTSIEFGGVEA